MPDNVPPPSQRHHGQRQLQQEALESCRRPAGPVCEVKLLLILLQLLQLLLLLLLQLLVEIARAVLHTRHMLFLSSIQQCQSTESHLGEVTVPNNFPIHASR